MSRFGEYTADYDGGFNSDANGQREDYYISTRYDFTDYLMLKLEAHYIYGFQETYQNTNDEFDADETDQFQFLTKVILYF